MRYTPPPPVMAVRVLSISTSLAASTATPGRTAPDASLTTPARLGAATCADAKAGKRTTAGSTAIIDLRSLLTSHLHSRQSWARGFDYKVRLHRRVKVQILGARDSKSTQ